MHDKPPFTKAQVNGASPKRPIEWCRLANLPIRYHMALEDVTKGQSDEASRFDLATLFNFLWAAKERKVIEDDGIMQSALKGLATAFRRTDDGKPFRLDGTGIEAMKTLVNAFEDIAKAMPAREYMRTCNWVHNEIMRCK
jgi:hypothetical protein